MNKKGVFLPIFVIFTAVILSVLFYIISTTEANKQDLVGLRAVNLIKNYDESEKINIYLDLSAKYASKETWETLANNGGYSENNRCEKTGDGYVLWNSCPVLNPSQEFISQFKNKFKNKINKYESKYTQLDYKNDLNMENPETQIKYAQIYTENVNNSNIINTEFSGSKLIITLSDVNLPVESAEGSVLVMKPLTSTTRPPLSVYRDLYYTIQENCIDKEFSECQSKLTQYFPTINIVRSGELIKVDLETNKGNIKLAFNPSQPIPEYQDTETYDYEEELFYSNAEENIIEETAIATSGQCRGLAESLIPIPQDEEVKCLKSTCCAKQESVGQIERIRQVISNPSQHIIINDAARSSESQRNAFLAFLAGRVEACGPIGIEDKYELEKRVPNVEGTTQQRIEAARNWLSQNDLNTLAIIEDLPRYSVCRHVSGRALDVQLKKGTSQQDIRDLRNIMCRAGWANYGREWWHYEYLSAGYDQAKQANKCYFSEDTMASASATVTPNYA